MNRLLPIAALMAFAPMLFAGNLLPIAIPINNNFYNCYNCISGGGYSAGYGISISPLNVIDYTGVVGYSAGAGVSISPTNVISATGATIPGSNQMVMYNDLGALGANSLFTYNDINMTLDVIGNINTNSVTGTYTGAQFRLGNKQLAGDYLGFYDQRGSTDVNTDPTLGFYFNNNRQGVVAYDSGIPYQIFYSDAFQNGLYLYPGGVGLGAFGTSLSQKFQVPNTGSVKIIGNLEVTGGIIANAMTANIFNFNVIQQQTASGNIISNAMTANYVQAEVTGSTNRLFATPADPSGTTSASFVMMGFGLALTPKYSGTVDINWVCHGTTTVSVTVLDVALAYGTGTAPVNGAAATGTQIAAPAIGFLDLHPSVSGEEPAVFVAEVKGLTLDTPYWFDAMIRRVSGAGTVALDDCMMSLTETA